MRKLPSVDNKRERELQYDKILKAFLYHLSIAGQ